MSTTMPKALSVETQNIPPELKDFNQWASWQWELRGGKWTKPPLNPSTGRYARNNDPETWGSFETALKLMQSRQLPGIGFMFYPRDPFAGVDLDGCRDPETGEIEGWAQEIVDGLGSYTEVSPSGTGLKIFVRGKLPQGRRRKGSIEVYDTARFFTTTGHRLEGVPTEIRRCQDEIDAVHLRVFGETPETPHPTPTSTPGSSIEDHDLIAAVMRSRQGERFARLWSGDKSGYTSASESDLALVGMLLFWTGGDVSQADRLFRQSGLMRPKWLRADYRERTFRKAFEGRTEFYSPPRRRRRRPKVYAAHTEAVRLGV